MNEAFASRDHSKLCWLANGVDPQPCGLIHYAYQQYAVTFIDNHDTFRDSNRFNGNILAANAFMISSTGTSCVFWKHWSSNKSAISKMIAARNTAGVTNMSKVRVLRHDHDCYMAEVYGTKGNLVVKIGPAMVSPEGYSDSNIMASGTDYCIWVSNGLGGDDPQPQPCKDLYLIGNLSSGSWDVTLPVRYDSEADGVYTWNDVEIVDSSNGSGYFSFVTATGSDWDAVNAFDRYGASTNDEPMEMGKNSNVTLFNGGGSASNANAWKTTPGNYSFTLDLNRMSLTLGAPSGVKTIGTDTPKATYYDLTGRKVENPDKGIYIRISGTKVTKIIRLRTPQTANFPGKSQKIPEKFAQSKIKS